MDFLTDEGILHTEKYHPLACAVLYVKTKNGFVCGHCEREAKGLLVATLSEGSQWYKDVYARLKIG